jgi:Ca2+-binding RTX toxin-like protein
LGNTGPDLIIGREGNDVINGSRGDDRLFAGEGDDTLIGGQGDDKLSGGTGADTFVWSLDDISSLGMEIDTVVDFDTSTNFEALNLSDLLQGESSSADSLENYLHFNFQSGNTVISVSSGGLFADNNNVGSMSGSATDQQIILLGVDLIGASATDAQVLQNLLTQQKLITD